MIVALSAATAPAIAAPASAAAPSAPLAAFARNPDIDEGGTPKLREQLNAASKGYLEAKAALEKSVKRQKQLATHLAEVEAELAVHRQAAAEVARVAYRTGRLGTVSTLIDSGSPSDFLDRAAVLGAVAASEDRQLRALAKAREQQVRAKAAIDHEVRQQKKQVDVMAKRKQQAERALAAAGSGGTSAGISGAGTATAKPAPRNADGSWPAESCSVKDPTTSGCLTPRTLHALQQAQAAGFTRYVSCYRPGTSGEHPKGRACDFAAEKGGFGGVATGGDRTYGDNLTAYYIRNASRLGVLYVIWYKQIWLPSSGWRAYNGGGDPSSDHTNHVHLSVY
ncbi:MAG TPA: hypothetical protein VFX61_05000 [Micromonosporaceae bacterium]|nr:hypothetical protein [Micromonosporaceae bacterium]